MEVDPEAVLTAALACPEVAEMSGGAIGEVATYLPGRQLLGVRVTDDEVEVHVVARWGRPLPEVADAVRAAVRPVAGGLRTSVFIEDIQLPEEAGPLPDQVGGVEPVP